VAGTRRRGQDPKAGLTDEKMATFDRVGGWRRARSEADGVPAFALLTNNQLRDLVVRRHRRRELHADWYAERICSHFPAVNI